MNLLYTPHAEAVYSCTVYRYRESIITDSPRSPSLGFIIARYIPCLIFLMFFFRTSHTPRRYKACEVQHAKLFPYWQACLSGKNSSGKSDENFPRRIVFPEEYGGKWRNFTNEKFSPMNKVIKELLMSFLEILAKKISFPQTLFC